MEALMGTIIRNSYIVRQLHLKELPRPLLLQTIVPVQFENTKIAHIRKKIAKPGVTESNNFQLLLNGIRYTSEIYSATVGIAIFTFKSCQCILFRDMVFLLYFVAFYRPQ